MALKDQFPQVGELLKSMVSYNSVNSGISGKPRSEEELVGFLQQLAEETGFETRRLAVPDQSDELLILYQMDSDLPWVLFDSHLDTVSLDGMTVEPLGGVEKGGRIWGRGACDTKGSGAAMFRALWEYARTGEQQTAAIKNNIALLFSVDEERGMTGIRAFAQTHYPDLGFFVKGAVVGEPTKLQAVIAHNGLVRYTVTTHGIAAHSANPSLGKSAISDMARLITFLEEEFIPTCDTVHHLTGKAQCSINVIRGGTAANIIPESCEIQIDRRVVPGENQSEAVHGIDGAIGEFQKRYPESEVTLEQSIDAPALNDAVTTDFAANLLRIIADIGLPEKGTGATYGTHAGDLQLAGFPAVVIGPGNIDQAHTKDEWIDAHELQNAVGVYTRLMSQL
jgi:acetylornithine deacetylase